jgi:hypothetical protein
LEDGTVTVTTTGDLPFVPGQSMIAADRPYVRYTKVYQPPVISDNVALNHPSSASSEAPGHTAGLAVDGDANTAWQAADNQANPWWEVNLEGFYAIDSIETTFGDKGNYQYKIEGSPDGKTWILLADETQTNSSEKVRSDVCAKNEHILQVRLTLTGLITDQPPLIAEVKVKGKPSP